MTDSWLQRWNDKFGAVDYAYGIKPNEFLKEQLPKLAPGKILFGGEGEGRNAVYAAKLGWEASAFDISIEGQKKAHKLAKENNVTIDYQVGELPGLDYENEAFDALALIYAHFPIAVRAEYHKILDKKLKPGGVVILEGFGEDHLKYRHKNPKVGGPPVQELLFSEKELRADFANYEILQLEEMELELHQGIYHNGLGSVIRFVAVKK